MHKFEQSVVASEKKQVSMKQRESVKLKQSVMNAKSEPMDQHQICYPQNLLATDSA